MLKAALERLSPTSTVVDQVDENPDPPSKKMKSLFNFMYYESDSPSTESQQRNAISKQVEEYIEVTTAPMSQSIGKKTNRNTPFYQGWQKCSRGTIFLCPCGKTV